MRADLVAELEAARAERDAALAELAGVTSAIKTIYAQRAAELLEWRQRDAIERRNHDRAIADLSAELARAVGGSL